MNVATTDARSETGLPRSIHSEEQQRWLRRVDELAPLIEEYRERTEKSRELPRVVFEALRDAGFPRMWVSRSFGGAGVDLRTGSLVISALARLDASVAWQIGVQGAIGRLSDYLPESSAERLFAEQPDLVVGGVNPSGRAERVEGGYLVSGEWAFASGSAHAEWLVCCAWETVNSEKVIGPAGPRQRMVFVPRNDVEMLDTWYTIGLRGTGSNHYRVPETFVAEDLSVDQSAMLTAPAARPSRAYPISYYDFGPFTSSSTAIGIAQDALDTLTVLANRKTPTGASSTLASSHTFQEKLARAEILVHGAQVLLLDTARRVTEAGGTGGDPLTSLVRLTAATVAESTVAAVDLAYKAAGTTSLYATSRLERCFRDIHSATKHITLSSSHFEMVGRYLLGGGLAMRR